MCQIQSAFTNTPDLHQRKLHNRLRILQLLDDFADYAEVF